MSEPIAVANWVHLPGIAETVRLWGILHDGDLESIESDLIAETVTFTFNVEYVRSFHDLPETTRFRIVMAGVQSVRAFKSVMWPIASASTQPSYGWREESWSWSDFEGTAKRDMEICSATLALGANTQALHLAIRIDGDSYGDVYVQGGGAKFFVGEREVTGDEFEALGEAYWKAWSARRSEPEHFQN